MNTIVTSKEEILCVSRALIQNQGWKAVNIRTVAKECNISIGSVYNYFENKADLIAATVESVWHDIFHLSENMFSFDDFSGKLLQQGVTVKDFFLYERRRKEIPGIFYLTFHEFSGRRKEQRAGTYGTVLDTY